MNKRIRKKKARRWQPVKMTPRRVARLRRELRTQLKRFDEPGMSRRLFQIRKLAAPLVPDAPLYLEIKLPIEVLRGA